MNILALDTGTAVGSVAVLREGAAIPRGGALLGDSSAPSRGAALSRGVEILGELALRGSSHSESLLPAVDFLLTTLKMTPDDIDLFAAAVGPGSFTGLRIGVCTVKGLAFGRIVPCVGVSSLAATAENARGLTGVLCPVIDARRDRVYNAIFAAREGEIVRLTPDRVLPIADLRAELLRDHAAEPLFLLGDAADKLSNALAPLTPTPTPPALRLPLATGVAALALRTYERASLAERAAFTDEALAPVYLRPSQAERELSPASARLGVPAKLDGK